ncbi:MAG: NAD/NADP octopine/nopaline dehydrogenase family protein [Solirubrobacteraceae bacterium]
MPVGAGPIAIVGMGNGGHAMAADLITRGFDVRVLIERDEAVRMRLNELGAIELTGMLGVRQVRIPEVVADVGAAAECRWVMVVTTADAHASVAAALAPVANAEQTVILQTGYVAGSRLFAHALVESGVTSMPVVAEMNTLIYSACAYEPGRVHVNAVKRWVELGAEDTETAREVANRVQPMVEPVVPAVNALASGLNNPNPITHVPILLANFSLAEAEWTGGAPAALRGGFFHLAEYIAPSITRLQAALEGERVAVMRALGMGDDIVPSAEFVRRCYPPGSREASPPRVGKTFSRRFYAEDVPCGLVPLEALGKSLRVPTPAISGAITVVSWLVGDDLRALGRRNDLRA